MNTSHILTCSEPIYTLTFPCSSKLLKLAKTGLLVLSGLSLARLPLLLVLEGVLALFSWSDWSVGWFLEVIFCTFQLVRLRDQLAAN